MYYNQLALSLSLSLSLRESNYSQKRSKVTILVQAHHIDSSHFLHREMHSSKCRNIVTTLCMQGQHYFFSMLNHFFYLRKAPKGPGATYELTPDSTAVLFQYHSFPCPLFTVCTCLLPACLVVWVGVYGF